MKHRLFKLVLFLLLGAIVNIAVAWGCALWPSTDLEIDITSNLGGKTYDPTLVPEEIRKFHKLHLPPELKIQNEVRSSRITSGYNVHTIRSLENTKHYMETAALSVGWPAPALVAYHTYYINTDDEADRITEEWDSGTLLVLGELRSISGHPLWPPSKLLPFYPIWLGFAINTILYAIALIAKPIGSGIRIIHEPRIANQQMAYWRALPYQPIWRGFAVNTIFYAVFVWVFALLLYSLRLNIRLKRGRCLKCNYDLRGSAGGNCGGCPECGWGRESEA